MSGSVGGAAASPGAASQSGPAESLPSQNPAYTGAGSAAGSGSGTSSSSQPAASLPAQVRVIDGQSVLGTVQSGGVFLSEDGTLLQLPDGFVERGKIDANGNFLAVTTVNGQQVWGSFGTDHSFLSQDGTLFVPSGEAAETGVTDPGTKTFLPGGTTYTLPDGKVLFGFADAGGFWSYDGSTIVLNGTAVTGSMNKGDGIFTSSNGQTFLVGQNGIQSVTPNPDGSFTVSGSGEIVPTPQSWKVDLEAFTNAQRLIGNDIQNVSDAYSAIQTEYSTIESLWMSPAGTSFEETTSAVDLAMTKLNTVLDSIVTAMQQAYNNYLDAEQQTIASFQSADIPTS